MKKKRVTKLIVFPPNFVEIEEEPGIEVHHMTAEEVLVEVTEGFGDRRVFVFQRFPHDSFFSFEGAFVVVLSDDLARVHQDYSLGANLVFSGSNAGIVELVKMIALNVEPEAARSSCPAIQATSIHIRRDSE